jgi:hypothetical protein
MGGRRGFDAGTGLGAFVVGAIATATSYSVAFGVLALAPSSRAVAGRGRRWPDAGYRAGSAQATAMSVIALGAA